MPSRLKKSLSFFRDFSITGAVFFAVLIKL
jgi:hypothetical protein